MRDGWEEFLMGIGALTCLSLVALVLVAAAAFLFREPAPPLVGYGCEGANGPLYAHEESAFPLCKEIKRR